MKVHSISETPRQTVTVGEFVQVDHDSVQGYTCGSFQVTEINITPLGVELEIQDWTGEQHQTVPLDSVEW